MIEFFSNIELDKQSFWLGFIAGAIFLWFIIRLRVYLPKTIKLLKKLYQDTREGVTSGVEIRYRNEVLNYLQRLHLTSMMFSLDEIVIPPRLLALTPLIKLEDEPTPEDIVSLTLPYLPDWPELSAKYNAPTISLAESLKNGANIILLGAPGSGRTVSLAYMAISLLRREINDSSLENLLPIYFHVQELDYKQEDAEPLDNLIKCISTNLSTITQQRLPSLIKSAFESGRILMLIDGLDEISAYQYEIAVDFTKRLLNVYPEIRVMVATSPNKFAGLTQLGFVPMPLIAWNDEMIDAFINNFGQMWNRFIFVGDNSDDSKFENLLIKSWLESQNLPQGPLELTLRVWSSYAGDLIGDDLPSNIEAYVRRMSSELPGAGLLLERIAADMLLNETYLIHKDSINSFSNNQNLRFEQEESQTELDSIEPDLETVLSEDVKIDTSSDINTQEFIQDFIQNGLLVSNDNHFIQYAHPEIASYLFGKSLSNGGDIIQLLDQRDWAGKELTIAYYLHFNEDGENIINLYKDPEDILHKNSLSAARWIKTANSKSAWYPDFLRYLATKLQNESLTLGLAGRFLIALALTNDMHIQALFRKLLTSEQANIRQLAALGCGLIKDTKSVTDLAKLINDPVPAVSRAACLALVAIGNKSSLETVATALLQGSEMVRRYAAEALANNREEGYPALRDGSTMEDLLVRRAVVFGLARVNQKWAIEILEQMQLEDQQWIVRNAAIQALEYLNQSKPYIPRAPLPLTEIPWLIDFASKLGIGVVPGQPAINLLIQALRDGDEELRLLALDYLRVNGIEEVIPVITEIYHSSLGDVREAAFNTLWHMSASGYNLQINPEKKGYKEISTITNTKNNS